MVDYKHRLKEIEQQENPAWIDAICFSIVFFVIITCFVWG